MSSPVFSMALQGMTMFPFLENSEKQLPDGGRIIAQKAVEIKEGDTPEILQKRVMEQAEWIILPQAVEKVSKELTEAKQ